MLFITSFFLLIFPVKSFSGEVALLKRSRLREALLSPSGKLTFSPEILIPEPIDPTAILLQKSQTEKLSESIRTKGKANAVFVSCSLSSLRQLSNEQEEARGNVPGPVPLIYCCENNDVSCEIENISKIAEAGASGMLLPIFSKDKPPLKSVEALREMDDEDSSIFVSAYKKSLENGLQSIPEIILDENVIWNEEDMIEIVDFLKEKCCNEEPVALIVTMGNDIIKEEESDDEEAKTKVNLPAIPKSLKKNVVILGSVRVEAGKNRMRDYTSCLHASRFMGAFLRAECVPGQPQRLNPEIISQFWNQCIGGLKSTRSKNFGFRTEINVMIDRDVPMEWYNLQKSVTESGALGETHGSINDLDTGAGDFVGF